MNSLTKRKVSWWHRLMHWLGLVNEFVDVYCKENDDMVYVCHRCDHCNNARDEKSLGTKAFFLSPLASFGEDMQTLDKDRLF